MTTKTALITGVSRRPGLGFAVARQLAEEGFHVILCARDIGRAELLARELRQAGLSADAMTLDLADHSSINALAAQMAVAHNRLDVLVNNASAMPDFETDSALKVDFNALQALFDVNVFGCWALIQALLPLLRQAPHARIVNITSQAALQIGSDAPSSIFSPAYSLAKYNLNALTATLAAALADTPILINAVDPGSIATHPERGDDENDRSPEDAAKGVVWAATLDADGPTGSIFSDGQPVSVAAP